MFIVGWYIYANLYYGHISLEWNANQERDIAGYKIYYGTSSRSYANIMIIKLTEQSQVNVLRYNLSYLEKNKKYYIAVTAYNRYGLESSYSNEVEGYAR